MRKISLLLVLVALLVAVVAPVHAQDEPQSIAAIAAANPDFSTLVAAASAAGLVDALDQTGPYTVFAPPMRPSPPRLPPSVPPPKHCSATPIC